MSNIFEFEFKKPAKQNAPTYFDIRAGKMTSTIDPIVYCIVPKSEGEMYKGDGVLEMQKRIATVFKQYKDDLYKKHFSDPKNIENITSGVYNAPTMELVMDFQKIYIREFRDDSDQIPTRGFGSFGGYTKRELDSWYGAALRAFQKKGFEIDKDLVDKI